MSVQVVFPVVAAQNEATAAAMASMTTRLAAILAASTFIFLFSFLQALTSAAARAANTVMCIVISNTPDLIFSISALQRLS